MPTDRQRVEASLPCFLMLDVVLNGIEVEDDGENYKRLKTHLALASTECVQDLMEPARSKILRRSERAYHDVFDEYRKIEGGSAKLGLIGYYLLRALTDGDYLVIGQESQMQQALDMLLPLLEEHASIAAVDRSAQKQARKVLMRLQGLGYYGSVQLPDLSAA